MFDVHDAGDHWPPPLTDVLCISAALQELTPENRFEIPVIDTGATDDVKALVVAVGWLNGNRQSHLRVRFRWTRGSSQIQ